MGESSEKHRYLSGLVSRYSGNVETYEVFVGLAANDQTRFTVGHENHGGTRHFVVIARH
jgi:hypothetical protein